MMQSAAGLAATGALAMASPASAAKKNPKGKAVQKGRINQSIVHWCFKKYWDVERTSQIAKQLGCKSVELVGPDDWKTLKKYDLVCALAPSHLFVQGMNHPKYQEPCIDKMKKAIDACVDFGFKTVITFTGFAQETGDWADGGIPDFSKLKGKKFRTIDPDEGIKNCVKGFKQIVKYAEKKKINLSLEMLNSRVDIEMKGHPGYQGDHTDYCMEIVNQVSSKRFGLLFDIYHVQIMDGDVISRIRQYKDSINHVHTAGNPGRGELDEKQEIYYPPIMEALAEIKYKGYVGQEFIPTRDPLKGLKEAVALCDV